MHTISLLVNDITLMLTDVERSLASLHNVLTLFNRVSHCKVNDFKSHILDLGVPNSIKNKLTSSFPYVWKQTGIKYLGITLTSQTKDLAAGNCLLFLSTLK